MTHVHCRLPSNGTCPACRYWYLCIPTERFAISKPHKRYSMQIGGFSRLQVCEMLDRDSQVWLNTLEQKWTKRSGVTNIECLLAQPIHWELMHYLDRLSSHNSLSLAGKQRHLSAFMVFFFAGTARSTVQTLRYLVLTASFWVLSRSH